MGQRSGTFKVSHSQYLNEVHFKRIDETLSPRPASLQHSAIHIENRRCDLSIWSMQANATRILNRKLLINAYLWAPEGPLRLWQTSSDTTCQTVKTIWEQRRCKHKYSFTLFLQSHTENTELALRSAITSAHSAVAVQCSVSGFTPDL